ncbi:hypothetical protein RB195_004022 [Necator americanus]|uniref:Protein quiver n=1 Tax=Necator americanus TaxID=51031 RepID=A0ABR1BK49_NECAM
MKLLVTYVVTSMATVLRKSNYSATNMKFHAVAFLLLVSSTSGKIRCYDCISPKNTVSWGSYCTEQRYCYGDYCTRGPNAKSNGILHGCSSSPPLDGVVSECKIAESLYDLHTNCYCKNNNFCNASPLVLWFVALAASLAVIICFVD